MQSEPFPEPTIRRQPTALPPATRGLELPRPTPPTRVDLPPTRAVDLPPRREPEPGRVDTHRTEPGTWREIIARFERELGPVTEEETAEEASSLRGGAPEVPDVPADDVTVDQPLPADPPTERIDEPEPVEPAASTETEPPAEPDETVQPQDTSEPGDETAETIQPGEPPFIDEPVPWEIESMTTPDYSPPHSIRDPEHDSWPVDIEDGDAIPAWSDEPDDQPDEDESAAIDEIGELLLDEVVPADPWDREPERDEETTPRSDFPLDAFIVPAGVHSVSGFDDEDIARRVAIRLDELARGLRDGGLRSLGGAESVDELSRVLAAIVTGYVSRGG